MSHYTDGTCLKTGCDLLLYGDTYRGDLFQFSDTTYIFNAMINAQGKARKMGIPLSVRETLIVLPGCPVFERRGVFVLSTELCDANQELADFLAKWAPNGPA